MNNNNNMMVPEGQYSHSLKLEETAKGLRISVHVYANDQETLIEQTLQTYLKATQTAIDNKIQLVPMGENENDDSS